MRGLTHKLTILAMFLLGSCGRGPSSPESMSMVKSFDAGVASTIKEVALSKLDGAAVDAGGYHRLYVLGTSATQHGHEIYGWTNHLNEFTKQSGFAFSIDEDARGGLYAVNGAADLYRRDIQGNWDLLGQGKSKVSAGSQAIFAIEDISDGSFQSEEYGNRIQRAPIASNNFTRLNRGYAVELSATKQAPHGLFAVNQKNQLFRVKNSAWGVSPVVSDCVNDVAAISADEFVFASCHEESDLYGGEIFYVKDGVKQKLVLQGQGSALLGVKVHVLAGRQLVIINRRNQIFKGTITLPQPPAAPAPEQQRTDDDDDDDSSSWDNHCDSNNNGGACTNEAPPAEEDEEEEEEDALLPPPLPRPGGVG